MMPSKVNEFVSNAVTHFDETNSVEDAAFDLLERSIKHYSGKIALVSSFGAESALLLHMVSQVDRHLPIIFVDTRMLFPETLAYQKALAEALGLSDIRHVSADKEEVKSGDRFNALHLSDANACCHLRKVKPLQRALVPFAATITGRKRYQSPTRKALNGIERQEDGKVSINPVVFWSRDETRAYFARHNLPAHPLVRSGFPSIGCLPCTSRVKKGEDVRAGRWRGVEKVECGIHLPA